MTQAIVFIDTSVLCNLVPVPGRDQDSEAIRHELLTRLDLGYQFVLPITTVIETGNFIAQIKDGNMRRTVATKMAGILRLVCEGKAPWVLHDVAWNRAFLSDFLAGGGSHIEYVQLAINEVGAGDLCILTERQQYQDRTGIAAEVWTLDRALAAHN